MGQQDQNNPKPGQQQGGQDWDQKKPGQQQQGGRSPASRAARSRASIIASWQQALEDEAPPGGGASLFPRYQPVCLAGPDFAGACSGVS